MKAKWLWPTWAYLSLVAVIALEVLLIYFAVIFIIPRFERLLYLGVIDPGFLEEQRMTWMPEFLRIVSVVGGDYTMWWIIVPALAWGLFEWRVRSDNKPFMRLAALGTAALALMVVVSLTAACLLIPFCQGVPLMSRPARSFAVEQIARIDKSVGALEEAQAMKNWEAMQDHADEAVVAMDSLVRYGPAVPSLGLGSSKEPPTVDKLRADVKAAKASLREVQRTIRDQDADRLDAALKKFHEAFAPVQAAAKKPPR
jgi:hypothetical protein